MAPTAAHPSPAKFSGPFWVLHDDADTLLTGGENETGAVPLGQGPGVTSKVRQEPSDYHSAHAS